MISVDIYQYYVCTCRYFIQNQSTLLKADHTGLHNKYQEVIVCMCECVCMSVCTWVHMNMVVIIRTYSCSEPPLHSNPRALVWGQECTPHQDPHRHGAECTWRHTAEDKIHIDCCYGGK